MSVFDVHDDDALEAADDELPAGEVTRHGKHGHGKIAQEHEPVKHWWALRASKLGEYLDDKFKIHERNMRLLAVAYARNPDLSALVGSVADITAPVPTGWRTDLADLWERETEWQRTLSPYKRDIERYNLTALDRVGANAKSHRGTAYHGYHEHLINGTPPPPHTPADIRAGLEVIQDLLRGIRLHCAEQFVVFPDYDCPAGQEAIPSCGTFDWLGSPEPGKILFAPDGTVLTSKDRIIGDDKSGDWPIQKPSYECQPVPYCRGRLYDHTLTMERRQGGENGLLDWPDDIRPNQRWALIAHVPLSHLDDAGLYWVDVNAGESWARAAQAMRKALREAQRMAKNNFYAADPPMLDPAAVEPPPAAVPAEPVQLAKVHELPLDKRIALCDTVADLDALYEANITIWSTELADLARDRWTKIQRKEAGQ